VFDAHQDFVVLHNLQAPCTVIFVYGGAWSSGDKSMYGLLARDLASPRFDRVEMGFETRREF
jgi:acetyl esterase/lipase